MPAERKNSPHKLLCPRALPDFDDGGAFPEVHVAQYSRHMENPHVKKKSGGTTLSREFVNVQVNETGEVSYNAIIKGGTNAVKKHFLVWKI
jgi:SNW domain-containing protein 1